MNVTITFLIEIALTFVASIAGIAIAYLVYQLDRRQHKETWIRTYREIHAVFWNDPNMAKVRYWINYDRAYLEIKPVLEKRRKIADGELPLVELFDTEYKVLDDLDKFYNLVLQVIALNKHVKADFGQDLWTNLYFSYWVKERIADDPERSDLLWYIKTFYGEELYLPLWSPVTTTAI